MNNNINKEDIKKQLLEECDSVVDAVEEFKEWELKNNIDS